MSIKGRFQSSTDDRVKSTKPFLLKTFKEQRPTVAKESADSLVSVVAMDSLLQIRAVCDFPRRIASSI